MSELYAYICTKSTVDPYVPRNALNLALLSQDVSDAFMALSGGFQVVGRISFFPVQRAVPFHLLCDGQEVPKASFQELYAYLADTQGAAADPDNFVLPNYLTGLTPAATAEPETVTDGGVSTPSTPDTQPEPEPGTSPTAPVTVGVVDSGGRYRKTGLV